MTTKVELKDLMDIYIVLDQRSETSKPVIRKITFDPDEADAIRDKNEGSWVHQTQINLAFMKDSLVWEHCDKHNVDYIKGSRCYPCNRL